MTHIEVDVTDPGSVTSLAREFTAPNAGLDVVVVSVGGAERDLEHDGRDLFENDERLRRLLDVHVTGTLLVASALRAQLAQRRGSLIVVTSRAGSAVDPNVLSYGAAKRAQEHVVAALAREWNGSGIRLYCVAPGRVDSPVLKSISGADLRPALQPIDVAAAVAELAEGRHPSGTKVTIRQGTDPVTTRLHDELSKG